MWFCNEFVDGLPDMSVASGQLEELPLRLSGKPGSRLIPDPHNEGIDAGDGAEVYRPHIEVGNLQTKLSFDGEHEIDQIERGQSALAEIVVVTDWPLDRSFGKQRADKGCHTFGRTGAIKHNKPPNEVHASWKLLFTAHHVINGK